MTTISICSQKGGIAKTTTATALAACLARRRASKHSPQFNVLLIDTDQQCNASDTYRAEWDDVPTLYDVIIADGNSRVNINDAIQHTEAGDIIAGHPLLRQASSAQLYRLRDALKDLEGYDFVILDPPPSIGPMLSCVLTASDYTIIPVSGDRYGIQGLEQIWAVIQAVQKTSNKQLQVAGALLVRFDRRLLISRAVENVLEKQVPSLLHSRLFATRIRDTIKVREAQSARMLLADYAKDCTAAQDYESFTDEVLEVLGYGEI